MHAVGHIECPSGGRTVKASNCRTPAQPAGDGTKDRPAVFSCNIAAIGTTISQSSSVPCLGWGSAPVLQVPCFFPA